MCCDLEKKKMRNSKVLRSGAVIDRRRTPGQTLTAWTNAFPSQIPQNCKVIGGGHSKCELKREKQNEYEHEPVTDQKTVVFPGKNPTHNARCLPRCYYAFTGVLRVFKSYYNEATRVFFKWLLRGSEWF